MTRSRYTPPIGSSHRVRRCGQDHRCATGVDLVLRRRLTKSSRTDRAHRVDGRCRRKQALSSGGCSRESDARGRAFRASGGGRRCRPGSRATCATRATWRHIPVLIERCLRGALRVGGGTRLKEVFEARMVAGKAVVSTTAGADPLPVTDGQNSCSPRSVTNATRSWTWAAMVFSTVEGAAAGGRTIQLGGGGRA